MIHKEHCIKNAAAKLFKMQEMREEEVPKFKVGQCGGCGLEASFWGVDGARVTCPLCGTDHEVECGEMLDLTTGEVSEVALLVPVGEMVKDGVNGERFEQRN